jgi:VWFA-related protein
MKLFLGVFCAVCAMAQQQPTFKTQAPLVVVPVTVSTKNGERIFDLKKEDFQLLDNGHEQDVTVETWGTYESHVSLVVVVQTSTLSKAALLKVKKVASMLDTLTGEGGEVAVISADSDVQTLLDFTKTWEDVQETFEKLHPSGGNNGHILDGVDSAITLLAAKPQGQRRLILLLSEARDRGSKAKASAVLTRAEKNNVTIYTASYSAYVTPFTAKASELQPQGAAGLDILGLLVEIAQSAKKNVGKTLAEYTGGRQLSFETLRRLEDDLSEIGKEIHSQYQLSFVPATEESPVYHSLTLTVKHHADLVIRARPGYWNGTN